MPVSSEPSLADMAASLYLSRKANAQRAVNAGQTTPPQADRALHPWLAIACLCGADLPELRELIAQEREGRAIHGVDTPVSETRARRTIADNICPRERWAKVLTRARDKALDAGGKSPEALALYRLSLALAFDPNGHHIPPYGAAHTPIAEAA
ncbi:hypothetical protein [Novosphingobium sp. SG707]|uniref:hypothetical protein n=1 Tax=Novosphingobium sp. SG707 TaxID=2586996 RepID=UPI001446BB6D|nr:hypothetical protein [Novosphingobium sp. SG707]NKI99615.1 hypothetical protein [Novosphingobium sp. SG707]